MVSVNYITFQNLYLFLKVINFLNLNFLRHFMRSTIYTIFWEFNSTENMYVYHYIIKLLQIFKFYFSLKFSVVIYELWEIFKQHPSPHMRYFNYIMFRSFYLFLKVINFLQTFYAKYNLLRERNLRYFLENLILLKIYHYNSFKIIKFLHKLLDSISILNSL